MKLIFILLTLIHSFPLVAQQAMKFEYQELAGDYQKYKCEHKHEKFYDWLVWCQKGNKVKKYRVHLAVKRYPKTVFGSSGYEVLYWITDYSRSKRGIVNDSITFWVHNSEDNNVLRGLQLRQGVENDIAQLNLHVSWMRVR